MTDILRPVSPRGQFSYTACVALRHGCHAHGRDGAGI